MRIFTILMLAMFLSYSGFSQQNEKAISKMVKTYKEAGVTFAPVNLFQSTRTSAEGRDDIQEVVSEATILKLNQQALRTAIDANKTAISLEVPSLYRQDLVLELVQVDIFAPGFTVRTSGSKELLDADLGLHYRGVIKGISNSLVAISIFEDEMSGFIADDEGNLVLGKMEGKNPENEHILYLDANMNIQPDYECGVQDDDRPYTPEDLMDNTTRDAGDCVQIYVEVDNDIYNDKGNGTTNYITGVFNQSATLYANESIETYMSDLYIWTTNSPYTGTSSSTLLSQFQSYRNSFNGDIGHLLSYDGAGGIAAGFSGVCNSNLDANMCFSGIQSSYSTVPTWSWTVSVFVHEMGHLFGSRHTHACVWNGNNTAIDGCAGSTEGSCSNPGSPSGGGTIMSYCHFTTGINFNLGFGSQPGAVIRNRIAQRTCLIADCGGGGGGPTCSDGVQNGDETGVDCGGSSCPACPTNCTENDVTLTITLDNYPEETSWSVTSGGNTVANGGTYGNQADGSTITIDICLADGCYDFNIFDAYGDGICCGYGNGSYALRDADGNTLASGGQFASSETTNFCVSGAPAPTCTDGIQNGDETGVDCGGSSCPACPTPGGDCLEIDLTAYTVNSYGGSQDNGQHTVTNGYISITNNGWKSISLNYNITANTVIEFEFGSLTEGEIHGIGFDDDNAISSNLTFQVHGTQNWGISDYNNYSNIGYWVSYTIPVGQFYTGAADRLFFVADHDGGSKNGDSFFQNIRIYEGSCGNAMPQFESHVIGKMFPEGDTRVDARTNAEGMLAKAALFPNPAQDVLNVSLAPEFMNGQIAVVDLYGKVMMTQPVTDTNMRLNVADLSSGMYFLQLQNGTHKQIEKFVVKH